MNIGILGGSFDPIHNGHLHMAKCAYESYALDQVWLIPAGHSPNKDEHGMTDAKDRFQMCKLAAQPYPWMTVSRLELDSAERSYTYRTMEKLSEQFPMHRFFFIMGGDSLDYFEQWKQPERIAKLATHSVRLQSLTVAFEPNVHYYVRTLEETPRHDRSNGEPLLWRGRRISAICKRQMSLF